MLIGVLPLLENEKPYDFKKRRGVFNKKYEEFKDMHNDKEVLKNTKPLFI